MKTLALRYTHNEYSIINKGGLLEVTEYREVRAFRGYRTVKIKPVLMTGEQLKVMLSQRHDDQPERLITE